LVLSPHPGFVSVGFVSFGFFGDFTPTILAGGSLHKQREGLDHTPMVKLEKQNNKLQFE